MTTIGTTLRILHDSPDDGDVDPQPKNDKDPLPNLLKDLYVDLVIYALIGDNDAGLDDLVEEILEEVAPLLKSEVRPLPNVTRDVPSSVLFISSNFKSTKILT
ncbi:Uncharacterized protein Fot_55357 [Forsythia ovata]|uniref:Uncharacterized protein n=1 Tax=Forsythia ovata TaxID=205694 RepID=A0ABD1P4I4_9LAMI